MQRVTEAVREARGVRLKIHDLLQGVTQIAFQRLQMENAEMDLALRYFAVGASQLTRQPYVDPLALRFAPATG